MTASPSSTALSPETMLDPSLQLSTMPAITESQASEALNARIQALPQELQDAIRERTDAFQIPAFITITDPTILKPRACGTYLPIKSYKPPVALQLNRKLRAEFAKDYYSSITLIFQLKRLQESDFVYTEFQNLRTWITGLSESHRMALRTVRFGISHFFSVHQLPETILWMRQCLKKLKDQMRLEYTFLPQGEKEQQMIVANLSDAE